MKLEQKPVSEETQPTIEDLQRQVLDLKTEFLALDRLVGTTRTEQANLASTITEHHNRFKNTQEEYASELATLIMLAKLFSFALKVSLWLIGFALVWAAIFFTLVMLMPDFSPFYHAKIVQFNDWFVGHEHVFHGWLIIFFVLVVPLLFSILSYFLAYRKVAEYEHLGRQKYFIWISPFFSIKE